jgi:hypothetical protein
MPKEYEKKTQLLTIKVISSCLKEDMKLKTSQKMIFYYYFKNEKQLKKLNFL